MTSIPVIPHWNRPLNLPPDCKQLTMLEPSVGGWVGVALPVDIHHTTSPGQLNAIDQGTDYNNRIGNRINMLHLQMSLWLEAQIIDRGAIARVMVVYWKEALSSTPLQELTLFRNVNIQETVFGPREMALMGVEWPNVPSEADVLYDATLNFPRYPPGSTYPRCNGLVNIDIPLGGRYTNYNGALGEDAREGSLWLYCFDSSDPAARAINWKQMAGTIYYVDR